MFNIWKHIRMIGGLTALTGAIIHRGDVMFLGVLIQYVGLLGGLESAEQRLLALEPKEEEKKENDDARN